MMLVTAPNIVRPDEAYAMLLAAHEGLSEVESHTFNAKLILLLMNHIGDIDALAQALKLAGKPARESARKG